MDARELSFYTDRVLKISTGGIGSGATGTAVLAGTGGLRSATIKVAGSGYSLNDVLTVATGTGGTFTVTGVGGSGEITAITLLAAGTGYANVDGAATTVAPAGGTNCTLTTTCEFAVSSVTIGGGGGSNYVSATPTFSGGGGGADADGTATIGSGADAGKITVIAAPAGKKYTSIPTITITGGLPADGARVIESLKEFDLTLQNARIKEVLIDSLGVNVIDATAAAKIQVAIAAL